MFIDLNLRVSSAQAAAAGNTVSTNSIDTSAIALLARDLGSGTELFFQVVTVTTVTGTTTGIAFQIIGASDAALTTNVVVFGSSDTIPTASLVADAANTGLGNSLPVLVAFNPQIINKMSGSTRARYVGIRYVAAAGTVTAGAFTADLLVDAVESRNFYPAGFVAL